ncbi:MAG: hypothetical protein HFF90_07875 [Oscillibacter sp.]|nr:hypothetical protein [Oscillibacter sp.]
MNEIINLRKNTAPVISAPPDSAQTFSCPQEKEAQKFIESIPKRDAYDPARPSGKPAPDMPEVRRLLTGGEPLQIQHRIANAFEEYFQGTIDQTALFKTLDNAVSSMVSHCAEYGYNAEEIAPKVIQHVYELSRSDIVRGAYNASYKEGRQVGRELGVTSSCWAYYNADYYYGSEGLIDSVHSHMEALGLRYSGTPLDLARDFPEGDLRNQFYASYNASVNAGMRQTCGNMIDEALAPPKGFRMFFDPNGKGMNRYPASMGKVESPESAFDGAVYIQCGDWRFEHRVPIRMDPTRFPVSVHLLDVVRAAGTPVPDGLETFLGNFDFFATNVGKLYTDAHKRRY